MLVLVPGRVSTQTQSFSCSLLPLSPARSALSSDTSTRFGRVALLVSGGRRGSELSVEVDNIGGGGGRCVGGGGGGGILPPFIREDGPVLVGKDKGSSLGRSFLSFSPNLEFVMPAVATVEGGGGGGILGGRGGGPVGGLGIFGRFIRFLDFILESCCCEELCTVGW
jgi:hypothetical protein